MEILKISITIIIILASITEVALIGKPREPYKPFGVIFNMIVNVGIIYLILN